ncbi:hypothetical protein F511_32780 [Dorcoceras hygrometricum]|uniref:Uncharacterized protein n=1 Tax=Dorcoceras hygrometricum TaxID=472368 RepID=A0A2Z7CCN3_9LAMI|nr:hypothetical protein F511_32780 [Dorcoceras hygrometricum]
MESIESHSLFIYFAQLSNMSECVFVILQSFANFELSLLVPDRNVPKLTTQPRRLIPKADIRLTRCCSTDNNSELLHHQLTTTTSATAYDPQR